MPKDLLSRAASCADYDSAEDEEVAGTRKQANVAAKRVPSHSSDLGKRSKTSSLADLSRRSSPAPRVVKQQTDLASDSGYSSRTQATTSSADSAVSGSRAKPVRSSTDANPRRRPAVQVDTRAASAAADVHGQQQYSARSGRPAPDSRSSSQRSAGGKPKTVRQCTDPGCAECVRGRKIKAAAANPTRSPPKSEVERAPSISRRRPSGSRDPAGRPQQQQGQTQAQQQPGPPSQMPAQPHPRPRSNTYTSASGSRPRSMYAHPTGAVMMPAGGHPAAYFHHGGYPYGATAPGPGYIRAGQVLYPERHMPQRTTTDTTIVSARRPKPNTVITSPVVSYDATANTKLSARRLTNRSSAYFDEGDDDETDESYEEDDYDDLGFEDEHEFGGRPTQALRQMLGRDPRLEPNRKYYDAQAARKSMVKIDDDRRRMPPPPLPATGQQYSMRTPTKPTRITYGGGPSPRDEDAEDTEELRETIRSLGGTTSSTSRRPSLASSGDRTKASSYSHPSSSGARITIERPNRNRRVSYMGGESRAQLEQEHNDVQELIAARAARKNRVSSDMSELIEQAVKNSLQHLSLDGSGSSPEDAKLQAAMAYQRKSGSDTAKDSTAPRTTPLTSSALRRKEGLSSETGSSRSKRSSNDGVTRISAGHRITGPTSERGENGGGGDEVKMRIDLKHGFEAEFEGRRLYLNPTGDGNAELVIGSRKETAYHNSKTSTTASVKNGDGRTRTSRADRSRERGAADSERRMSLARRQRAEASRERSRPRTEREEYEAECARRDEMRNAWAAAAQAQAQAQQQAMQPPPPPPMNMGGARYAPGPPANDYPPHAAPGYRYTGPGYPQYPPPPPQAYPGGYPPANSSGLYGA